MRVSRPRRLIGAAAFLSLLLFVVPQLGVFVSFPDEMRVLPGQEFKFDPGPLFTLVTLPPPKYQTADSEDGPGPSHYDVELRLFGLVPVERARVNVVSEVRVIPAGQAIGILLSESGLVVVKTVPVLTDVGEEVSPAAVSGVLPGDILLSAGGRKVDNPIELESITALYGQRGEPIPLVVRRSGRELHLQVTPVLARQQAGIPKRYMLGLFLKDPAAGVGTLTFWDPASGAYGALGHQVTEGESTQLSISDGEIVPALIHGIQPGLRGRPGEKVGLFESGSTLGSIEKNTPFGIFGYLSKRPDHKGIAPVPVALAHEVKEGPAKILTVLDGEQVRSFDVEILAVHQQARPGGKGLVIEVTDPELLGRTNGIVQGMSGSPILQDGKLVGAVTHVFINNPRRGFGVLAEWMVYEAGITAWEESGRLSS